MSKVSVLNEAGDIIARVEYNNNLDVWDGRNYTCGAVGRHLGITKLKKLNKYILIHGTQWQGERSSAEVVSDEVALQAILKSGNVGLLNERKYARLYEPWVKMRDEEEKEEEEEVIQES